MQTISASREICRLLEYGVQRGLMKPMDRAYAANRMLPLLNVTEFEPVQVEETLPYPAEPLDNLCALVCPDATRDEKDRLCAELMNCMMPRPSEVVEQFYTLYREDAKAATDYYYGLSRASNYIWTDRVAKDRKWTAPTPYGDLIITINLSKPEKDPKAIAAAKNAPQAGYPKCALCRENEGFLGSANQAARGNHRLIPLDLCGENWFLQYSPYVYYNEHCIILSEEHRPMKVSRASFEHLLEVVTRLPHYFAGSNADLPIVGGSILSHDHFQGGSFEFPMAKADLRERIVFAGYEDIAAGIVHWPMSVLRLRGADKARLTELADHILTAWRGYSDESADIFAFTGEAPHNTITPIARRRGDDYELDLVLRNNRTTEEHPLGLFHPHAEYHHIKRENIGLIEVMGLAILPPRLLAEKELMQQALAEPAHAEEIMNRPEMEKHRAWFDELRTQGVSAENAEETVQNSIGKIFGEILGNAGVYKDTEVGREAFLRFCAACGGQSTAN